MHRWAVAVFCIALSASFLRAEPKTWQLNASGQWTEAQTRPAAGVVRPNPTLDRAQALYEGRQYAAAHDLLLSWLRDHPQAPDRDRGLFLLAHVYYANGDRLWCFYECDELLDNLPESRLFFPALRLQYEVADAFLNGYKKLFLGLPLLPMEDTGIEMLFRIQERAPGSPIAEQALARTADYYYRTSQFDLAADAYGAFIRIYPRSDRIPRFRLRQAYSNFAQFHGPRYDATPLLDARAQFTEIQSRTPELAQEEGVQQFIDRIDEQLAIKLLYNADFYQRTGQPKGAVYLYRFLIQRYPNSKEAQTARQILSKMPKSTLGDSAPPDANLSPSGPLGP